MNCTTYSNAHTGKKARIATCSATQEISSTTGLQIDLIQIGPAQLTSKQYPNSNCSPSPACANNPCCLLLPGSPAIPGPSSRPTRKKAAVATRREPARKWMKTKTRGKSTIAAGEVEDAMLQARPVRSMKKERR